MNTKLTFENIPLMNHPVHLTSVDRLALKILVEILKSQLATQLPIYNECKADFREYPPESLPLHLTSMDRLAFFNLNTCNTLQHTATHCNALQHTATHCNTLILTSMDRLAFLNLNTNKIRMLDPYINTLYRLKTFYMDQVEILKS